MTISEVLHNELNTLRAENAALLVAIEAKQKALKTVEWEEYDDPDWGMQVFCPSCLMEKKHGHYECRLAEALSISPSAELLEARDRNLIADFIHEFKRHVGGDGEFWLHELEDFAELGEVR